MPVSLVSRGAFIYGYDSTLNLPFPSTPAPSSGDVLTMRVSHSGNAAEAAIPYTFPAGWTFRVLSTSGNHRHWLYTKISTGGESGAVKVVTTGSSTSFVRRNGRIDCWSGIDTSTNHGVFNATSTFGLGTSVNDLNIALNIGDAAINFISINTGGSSFNDFTGETGGNWITSTDVAAGSTAIISKMGIAYVLSATSTAIGGGSFITGASTTHWTNIGFAFAAATTAPASDWLGNAFLVGWQYRSCLS